MIFILLHYLLSFLTVTTSAHQRFLWCVVSSSTAISVPHSVRVRRYYGPPRGGGGPSLGDRPPGVGGGPSSLGWGRTKGGGRVRECTHVSKMDTCAIACCLVLLHVFLVPQIHTNVHLSCPKVRQENLFR